MSLFLLYGFIGSAHHASAQDITLQIPSGIPFALFKWKEKVWLGLPKKVSPALADTLQKLGAAIHKADGGSLYSFAVASDIFPALRKNSDHTCIKLTSYAKEIDLSPSFLPRPYVDTKHRLHIGLSTEHVLSFTLENGNKGWVVLTDRHYTGSGIYTSEPFVTNHPTVQGVFMTTMPDELSRNQGGRLYTKHALPFVENTQFFALQNAFEIDHQTTSPLFHLKALLRKGLFKAAHEKSIVMESQMPTIREDCHFLYLKAWVLALLARPTETLSYLGQSKILWKHTEIIRAIAYVKAGKDLEGFRMLNRKFSEILSLPSPLKEEVLLLGGQVGLILGRRKQANIFLIALSNSALREKAEMARELLRQEKPVDKEMLLKQIHGPYTPLNSAWYAYHDGVRKKFRELTLRYESQRLDLHDVLFALEKLAQQGRGGTIEFEVLEKMAFLYEKHGDYENALKAYTKLARYAPDDYPPKEKLMERARDVFVQGAFGKNWSDLKRCAFFKKHQKFLPPGERGDRLLDTFTALFVEQGLVDHVVPLLMHVTPQISEKKTRLLHTCVAHYIRQEQYAEALFILRGHTPKEKTFQESWQIQTAHALGGLGQHTEALDILSKLPQTQERLKCELMLFKQAGEDDKVLECLRALIKKTDSTEKKQHYLDHMSLLLYESGRTEAIRPLIKSTEQPLTSFLSFILVAKGTDMKTKDTPVREKIASYGRFRQRLEQDLQ